jgi:hypothetical protein
MKRRYELPPLDPLQRYTLEEAQGYLRISRAKLYKDVRAGRVQVILDGALKFVPGSEIARLSAVPSSSVPVS